MTQTLYSKSDVLINLTQKGSKKLDSRLCTNDVVNFWFRGSKGLTLIELTIVIFLMGIVMGLAAVSLTNITGANLRSTTRKLAGSMRFTYDLAARKNTPFRVVLDLDEHAWWVESSSERFLLEAEKYEVEHGRMKENELQQTRFVDRHFIESGEMWAPKSPPPFSQYKGSLTKKVTVANGIYIQDVWVQHQSALVTAGKAYVYCFPTGMTERAVIHLADENENIFTLWVYPLTGRVKIYPEYIEAPNE